MRELEQNAGRRPGELNPDAITVPADLSALMLATHPTRNRIPFDPVTIETSALLSITLADAQARIIEKTARSRATTQRGCFRTFHINARASIECVRTMLTPIIQHEWMAVAGCARDDIAYAKNTPGHWIDGGTSSDNAITSADMRRWCHALSEYSKRLDLIVSARDPVGSMVFALSALSENGCAIIRLNGLRPDVVAMIYVFVQYFTHSEYVHSMATDTSWIIGVTRMVAPNARVKRELSGWIDRGDGRAPFSDETMCSPAVLEITRALHRADSETRRWREDRYKRVLDVAIPVDMGRAVVEDLLAQCAATFPDWS